MKLNVRMTEDQYDEMIEALKQVLNFELAKVQMLEKEEGKERAIRDIKNRRNRIASAIVNLNDAHMRAYNRKFDTLEVIGSWSTEEKKEADGGIYLEGWTDGYEQAKRTIRTFIDRGGEQ